MKKIFKILTFILLLASFIVARDYNKGASTSSIKFSTKLYYFDVGSDGEDLYKKRSHKRRKIKRKPRRGRDNR